MGASLMEHLQHFSGFHVVVHVSHMSMMGLQLSRRTNYVIRCRMSGMDGHVFRHECGGASAETVAHFVEMPLLLGNVQKRA